MADLEPPTPAILIGLKLLKLAGLAVIATAGLVGAGLYFFQEKAIFQGGRLPSDFKFDFDQAEEIWIPFDGGQINSLFFHTEKAVGTILYFHGNAGALDMWGMVAENLMEKAPDWNIWMIDYPSYGKSTGDIKSEAQLYQMAETFYDFAVQDPRVQTGKIVIMGRSIGSGLASYVASTRPCSAVILETPYESLYRLVGDIVPLVPRFLLRYEIPSYKYLESLHVPILLLHGRRDEIIPYAHSVSLKERLGDRAEFVTFNEGHHNTLPTYDEYTPAVAGFLKKISK